MHIFLSCTSMLPSYGGPARYVARLASELASRGELVSIWSPDGSATSSPLLEPHRNISLKSGPLNHALAEAMPDIIHDNGIWRWHNHQLASFSRNNRIPRVVTPQGMLLPIALQHKPLRKKVAWCLCQRRDLRSAAMLHATSPMEAVELGKLRLNVPVQEIPFGVDLPSVNSHGSKCSSPRTALFMGRLHPIKGLPLLIETWARVKPPGWRMIIAGPDENGYQAKVEQLLREFDLTEHFLLVGPLEGDQKAEAFRSSQLFILPSFSESFGLAIGEALSYQLPVITTTGTPWKMLGPEKCGWSVPATVAGISTALKEACALHYDALHQMGINGRNFVERTFSWENIVAQTLALYQTCLNHLPITPAKPSENYQMQQ